MVEKITFKINTEGEVSVNVDCVEGSQCEIITKPFEEKLGYVVEKQYKDSYFSQVTSSQEGVEQETQS